MANQNTGAEAAAKVQSASSPRAAHFGFASGSPPSSQNTEPDELKTISAARSEVCVEISCKDDIVTARQKGRALAQELGFGWSETMLVTAAISEIGRNILDYARHGEILVAPIRNGSRNGVKIIARDDGPGIPDVRQAMQCGYSTRNRPGVGLPGAKWLMDEFDIESKVGKGTVITMKKWAENADGENQWLPLDV